jgi:AhpD family alkylhydroperoxidase
MSKEYPEITKEISHYLKELKSHLPELLQAWHGMSQAAFTGGNALDKKTRELIAIALGVAARCDGCLGFHADALVKLGASRQEVAEALGIAVYMGGGPSLMTAAEAMKAFLQFEAQRVSNNL